MSKNKEKKAKEVKEEIKAPSAEVSENGAEVEAEAGEENARVGLGSPEWLVEIESEMDAVIDGLEEVDHHNEGVILLTIEEAKKDIQSLSKKIAFIEKALIEKKK